MTISTDELYDRAMALSSDVEDKFLELGRSLRQLLDRDPGLFQQVVRKRGLGRRKAYYLVEVSRKFEPLPISRARLKKIGWTKLQIIGQHVTKALAPGTVNRSVVEPLRKRFIRARAVWRYQFPREPQWRTHRLKEPVERVREFHASEAEALDAALRPDFEPWFNFASATGLRLAETLITWDCVNWEARTIVTTGKGGRACLNTNH
jgi:hypothetical protein